MGSINIKVNQCGSLIVEWRLEEGLKIYLCDVFYGQPFNYHHSIHISLNPKCPNVKGHLYWPSTKIQNET